MGYRSRIVMDKEDVVGGDREAKGEKEWLIESDASIIDRWDM